jgi:hypothetical protein
VTFEAFVRSLGGEQPPAGLSPALRALWLEGAGDWAQAHEAAGEIETAEGALVHAYLHHKEGDLDNARYWYRRAGRAPFEGTLEEEWAAIVRELL